MAKVTVVCTIPHGLILTVESVSIEVKGVKTGVDADFWASWSSIHANSHFILNGSVYAHAEEDPAAEVIETAEPEPEEPAQDPEPDVIEPDSSASAAEPPAPAKKTAKRGK